MPRGLRTDSQGSRNMFNTILTISNWFSLRRRPSCKVFIGSMARENTLVRVKQGQLRGVIDKNAYDEEYLAFRGIPYAKPPIGQLRFQDPQPPESWTGIRDANEYGSSCAQIEIFIRELVGSDDCLYLNVYKPLKESSTKRAVMVWIHGGAFMHGSGNSDLYGPDYLLRKDIILVTINYRLGVLGFLNMEHELAPGNQGLKDQVMALKWIQENISSFGGDPNNVTIFGESAGAASVHYLTISPLAQGLFHKAISQSGASTNPWALMNKEPRKYAFQLAAKLGEHSTDVKTVLEFLRTVDPLKLVVTESQLLTPQERHIMFGVVGPGIDDKSPNPFLPQHPSVLTKQGVKVPYIIGYNNNEGSMFLGPFTGSDSEESLRNMNKDFSVVIAWETQNYLKKEGITAKDVKRLYFGDEPITKESMQQYANYVSDIFFLQGIHEVLSVQAEKAAAPTYFYEFSFYTDDSLMKRALKIPLPGASHAEELPYLFYQHIAKEGMDPPEKGTAKHTVMEYFTEMWSNFAKTGNPTPKITDLIKIRWKPLEKSDTYACLHINTTLKMEAHKRDGQRYDWKKLKNKL